MVEIGIKIKDLKWEKLQLNTQIFGGSPMTLSKTEIFPLTLLLLYCVELGLALQLEQQAASRRFEITVVRLVAPL